MPTSSFDQKFVINDDKAAKILLGELASPTKLVIRRRNIEAESKQGAKRLAKQLKTAAA